MTIVSDETAIADVVLDYYEGWFDGDERRMQRALHPRLTKRSPGERALDELSAADMIAATSTGVGKRQDPDERRIDIQIEDVYGSIANVTVRGPLYIEYLHLIRGNEGWKIANVLWDRAR